MILTFPLLHLQVRMEVELDGLFRQNISYDYDDNYEYKDDVDQRRASGVWIQILYSLLTVLGLLGNGLLIGAFSLKRKSRNSWTVSDIFIFNQGFADVLLLVTLPFWAVQASRPCGSCFTGVLCRISGAVLNVSKGFCSRAGKGVVLSVRIKVLGSL